MVEKYNECLKRILELVSDKPKQAWLLIPDAKASLYGVNFMKFVCVPIQSFPFRLNAL